MLGKANYRPYKKSIAKFIPQFCAGSSPLRRVVRAAWIGLGFPLLFHPAFLGEGAAVCINPLPRRGQGEEAVLHYPPHGFTLVYTF